MLLFTSPPPPRSTLFPYTTLFRSRPKRWNFSSESGSGMNPSRLTTKMKSIREATYGNQIPIAFDGSPCSARSEEHTSELQSLRHLVCRLLLEKKKKKKKTKYRHKI